jgi:hypothetical protein
MRVKRKTTKPKTWTNTPIPRPIIRDILPILILTDSIFKLVNPIAGVEIVAIPGLTAASLMFNLMSHAFISWLKLEKRGTVIVHVGTNDLFSYDLRGVVNCIIHTLYIVMTAGPYAVFSSILPRPRDHRKSDAARRFLNNTVYDYFRSDHYLPVP